MKLCCSTQGQSLTEYGLAGALVVLVSIGALVLLGGNLKDIFSEMIPKRPPTQTQAANLSNNQAKSPTTSSTNPSTACFSDNFCVDLSKIKQSEAIAIQTQGANGMDLVQDYSDLLYQLRDQLIKNDPSLDPILKYLITNTAVSGHEIANTEVSNGNMTDATVAFIRSREELIAYLEKHPDTLPPNLNNALGAAVDRIQGLSVNHVEQQPEYQGTNFYDAKSFPSTVRVSPLIDPNIESFATAIHQESNQACQQGGDQSTCIQQN